MTVVAEGRMTAAQAAGIGAAYMLGQFAVAIALPLLRVAALGRASAMVASVLLIAALSASSTAHPVVFSLCWFAIGAGCGALLYLATTAAAAFPNPNFAFALRLAITLVVSGLVIAGLQIVHSFTSYDSVIIQLSVSFAVISAIGASLYQGTRTCERQVTLASLAAPKAAWSGLIVVFVLFMGQIGFWTFALYGIPDQAMQASQVAMTIACSKAVAGAALLPLAYCDLKRRHSVGLLSPGILLAAALIVITGNAGIAVFALGMLCWEIGFNLLSARLQAKVVAVDPGHGRLWLTAALLLGAAVGPIAQGEAIRHGYEALFIAFAVASALLPSLWFYRTRRRATTLSANEIEGRMSRAQ
jgi:hypothetical protein